MDPYSKSSPDADVFDAGLYPPTWDFFTWIVNARLTMQRKGMGDEVPFKCRFKTSGLYRQPDPKVLKIWRGLLRNVCKPTLELFNAVDDPRVRYGNGQWYNYKRLHLAALNGEQIPKVQIPYEPEEGKLVLTIREAPYTTWRNSILPNWIEFANRRRAEGYRVIFVRDTSMADKPLHNFETAPEASKNVMARTKLYATAHCNLLVANGPASILWFSKYPFINFNPMHENPEQEPTFPWWWQTHAGVLPGQQFGWFEEKQKIVWSLDTFENIENSWQAWNK